jgi:hypothetical protein
MTVGPIDVPPQHEVLRCFWRKVPKADVTRIQIAYNQGSHHLDIFSVPYSMPDGDFDCSNPDEWGTWPSEVEKGLDPTAPMPAMLVGFQNDSVDWTLPQDVSYELQEGQQIMIQSHYANVESQGTPSQHMLDIINFYTSETPTANAAETLFDEDTNILLPAHQSLELTRICEFPQSVDVIAMFGHFHSRGTDFRVFQYDAATDTTGDLIYENQHWDNPPWYTVTNWGNQPMPCTAIKMIADYYNTTDQDITWGPYVQQNEHMETYAMFYPALGLDPACVCHREGELPPGVAAGTCN